MLPFPENDVLQDESVIVSLIPGRINEGDRALARAAAKLLQRFRMLVELRAVAAAELLPAVGVMAEPTAELGARRDLLEPFVELGFRLADSARPQAVDKYSCAVGFLRRFVGPLQPDVRSGDRAGGDLGGLRELAASRVAVRGLAERALELDFGEQPLMIAVHDRNRLLAAAAQIGDGAVALLD